MTRTGYARGKRNSGEVCSRNYRKFQGQGRTAPGIRVKSVPVCSDYEQANRRSKTICMDDMLFADDIEICEETGEEVEQRIECWRYALEKEE